MFLFAAGVSLLCSVDHCISDLYCPIALFLSAESRGVVAVGLRADRRLMTRGTFGKQLARDSRAAENN